MPAAIKHTKTTSSRSALLILIVANFSSRSSRYKTSSFCAKHYRAPKFHLGKRYCACGAAPSLQHCPREQVLSSNWPCVDGPPLASGFWNDAVCWLVQPCVRPVMRPCHAPLAMMPFARIGSRPIARTRGAPAKKGFPDPAVSTGFVHQLLSALPNFGDASEAPNLYACATWGSR